MCISVNSVLMSSKPKLIFSNAIVKKTCTSIFFPKIVHLQKCGLQLHNRCFPFAQNWAQIVHRSLWGWYICHNPIPLFQTGCCSGLTVPLWIYLNCLIFSIVVHLHFYHSFCYGNNICQLQMLVNYILLSWAILTSWMLFYWDFTCMPNWNIS